MRAAVVGAGVIGKEHLACLLELREAEVCAVCDVSPATAESTAERFGVPAWFVDHRRMLEEARPDVVHVTTPPASHVRLALDAIDARAHVIVEKPITLDPAELDELCSRAVRAGRSVIEDHNYVFQPTVQELMRLVRSGELGEVVHVEVSLCLDVFDEGSRYADANLPHPSLSLPGGPLADFATHLASLCHAFVGPARETRVLRRTRARADSGGCEDMRALVEAERGTASLLWSARSSPDAFWVRVFGTRMRAEAQLWQPRLLLERLRPGLGPLASVAAGLELARGAGAGALRGAAQKLAGRPGSYAGLWELVRRTYVALESGGSVPVSLQEIRAVNALVRTLLCDEATG